MRRVIIVTSNYVYRSLVGETFLVRYKRRRPPLSNTWTIHVHCIIWTSNLTFLALKHGSFMNMWVWTIRQARLPNYLWQGEGVELIRYWEKATATATAKRKTFIVKQLCHFLRIPKYLLRIGCCCLQPLCVFLWVYRTQAATK